MAKSVIKIKDQYFVWSSIVDAPVTYGLTYSELSSYWSGEFGNVGLEYLREHTEYIETRGTSNRRYRSVEEFIICNRAGDNESYLTLDEIYEQYKSEEN